MPKALASLPSARARSVSLATPLIESRRLSRSWSSFSRCFCKNGLSFARAPFKRCDGLAALAAAALAAEARAAAARAAATFAAAAALAAPGFFLPSSFALRSLFTGFAGLAAFADPLFDLSLIFGLLRACGAAFARAATLAGLDFGI